MISFNKIAHKLTCEDREFIQFDFNKSLTKEINCFSYLSFIYNTCWWVGMKMIWWLNFFTHMDLGKLSTSNLLLINVVLVSNVLCVITAPIQSLGECTGSQTLALNKLWKHMKTIKCSHAYIVTLKQKSLNRMSAKYFFPNFKVFKIFFSIFWLFFKVFGEIFAYFQGSSKNPIRMFILFYRFIKHYNQKNIKIRRFSDKNWVISLWFLYQHQQIKQNANSTHEYCLEKILL